MSQEGSTAALTAPEQDNNTATKNDQTALSKEEAQSISQESKPVPDSERESQSEWEEKEYIKALARLEELQDKLDTLRTTIPTLASPLRSAATSGRAKLFLGVRDAATSVSENLRDFEQSWRSAETREILERSAVSLGKDGDLSEAGNVPAWGWRDGDAAVI